MATHSSILAWRIPWTEEPDGLQSTEMQSQTQLNIWSPATRAEPVNNIWGSYFHIRIYALRKNDLLTGLPVVQ